MSHPVEQRSWPEDVSFVNGGASFVSRWLYLYMNPILKKGSGSKRGRRRRRGEADQNKHVLSQDDLYLVPSEMDAAHLDTEFRAVYEREERRLLRTLWRLAAPTFLRASLCQLVCIIAQATTPIVVWRLLLVLQQNPYESVAREGVPLAVGILLSSVLNAVCTHRQVQLATKAGVLMRAAVTTNVFRHALRLSPSGRAGLTVGEVTNLVAIDTQKLFEVTQEGNLLWSCPVSMVIITCLLVVVMGPVTLVGSTVLFLTVSTSAKIVSKMMNIRRKRVAETDTRVEMTSSMLKGVKVTKLNNYEEKTAGRVGEVRRREMKFVRTELSVWALTLIVAVSSSVIASAATIATYVLVSEDNVLTAADTFTILMLFTALKFPMNQGSRLIGKLGQAKQAVVRIGAFLRREVRESESFGCTVPDSSELHPRDWSPILSVKKGTFVVGSELMDCSPRRRSVGAPETPSEHISIGSASFVLSNIQFSLDRSQVLAVVGPVGGGKTSLVNALLGEIPSASDTRTKTFGKVAFANQTPFILNATVRENILFGSQFDPQRYDRVINACCLRPDIAQMGSAADLTEIGERGITLSGGQKQRINIARVVYACPDIAIFDDPLSALDADTAKQVFANLFEMNGNTLLSMSAVVLVTHASHFLQRVDKILLLVDGQMKFCGPWDNLDQFECQDDSTTNLVNALLFSVQEKGDDTKADEGSVWKIASEADTEHLTKGKNDTLQPAEATGEIMTVEDRGQGLTSVQTWYLWFKYAGGWPFLLFQVVFLFIDRAAYVASDVWLSKWTEAYQHPIEVRGREFSAQTEGRSAQYQYLKVYACIILVSFIGLSLRSEWAVFGGARCSERLFKKMLTRVLGAPLVYFETTPLGRILNRFTYDVEVMDTSLTQSMTGLMISISWFTASVCVMIAVLPWMLVILVPCVGIYLMVQLYYRRSGPDLQRLDSVSRSPISSQLAEGLEGATTIRVFGQEDCFMKKFQMAINDNSSAMLNFISAQRWLAVRIQLLGAFIVFVACLFVVLFNDTLRLDPGIVGLLVVWSSTMTVALGFLFDRFSEAEAAIISVERIHNMTELPQERSMSTSDSNEVEPNWPTQGLLEFENVAARYRKGLPLALDGATFRVDPRKRCGVVGRTGAGKSTLTAALFRLIEVESGRILLDGVDLSTIGLSDVRTAMSIIPQDPVLFPGSLRQCLDPFGLSTDAAILEALAHVRLCGVNDSVEVLDSLVEEGGVNFSVGERQLLCLARAFLSRPKVLVMDEATASVDAETDTFIQKVLRTHFEDTTLLTIAHRLSTIMDYDYVLVMDQGRAVEFDSPYSLLQMEDGIFTDLVNATGEESANVLRSIAERSCQSKRERWQGHDDRVRH